MNRIVLIGNGFDLAHGLPTRYEDFINDYWVKFINEASKQRGGYVKDCVNLQILVSNYTLQVVLRGDNPANYIDLKNSIQQYGSGAKLGIDNEIFKHLSALNQLSWVDIENEYYRFLCYQFDIVKLNNYDKYENVRNLNHDFEYIKQKLKDYLSRLLTEKQVHKSDRIQKIIYSPFNLDEFTEDAKNEWINDEARNIKLFNPIYNRDVISQKTVKLLETVPGTDAEFLKIKMYDRLFWNENFDLRPNDIMFLNFNYTNLEELYIDKKKPVDNKFIPLDIHIHGELNNPNNPIIFGYGDELEDNYKKLENLQDNNYLENIKSIKYLETDNYKRILDFINSDKYQIIILGHSCGNSDRTLLNTLFEHENCVSIKPYYYQYKEGDVIKDNYSEIVRNISRSFTDKKSMRDKVVNKTYTDWFSRSVK